MKCVYTGFKVYVRSRRTHRSKMDVSSGEKRSGKRFLRRKRVSGFTVFCDGQTEEDVARHLSFACI